MVESKEAQKVNYDGDKLFHVQEDEVKMMVKDSKAVQG